MRLVAAWAAVLLAYATILPDLDFNRMGRLPFLASLKAKHVANAILLLSLVMLAIDRNGVVIHSAIPGGLAAGWLYANCSLRARLLGAATVAPPPRSSRTDATDDAGAIYRARKSIHCWRKFRARESKV